MGHLVTISIGQLATAGALLLVALAFATDHWIDYTVNRTALKTLGTSNSALNVSLYTNPIYYSRHRGLFRTCYVGSETYFLNAYAAQVVDGNCLVEQGYELTANPLTVNWGADYTVRKHLLRAHFGTFIASMVMLVIGCVCGAVGCWGMRAWYIRAAAILVFCGGFFASLGIGFFHGYDHLEKNKIVEDPFPAKWNIPPLSTNTSIMFGYSYIIGWCGVGLAMMAALLFLCAAFGLVTPADDGYGRKRGGRMGRSNPAYAYMDYPSAAPVDYGYPTMGGPALPALPAPSPYMVQEASPYDYRY